MPSQVKPKSAPRKPLPPAGYRVTKYKNGKVKFVSSATPGIKARKNGSGKGFKTVVKW